MDTEQGKGYGEAGLGSLLTLPLFGSDSRAVAVHLDRVDAVLGEASALQERSVVTDLHTLTGEVTVIEELDAVVLSVLKEDRHSVMEPPAQVHTSAEVCLL